MTIKKIEEEIKSLYIDKYYITDPSEIDIEAIAYDHEAIVLKRELSGCEAMIIGAGNKATITVNETSHPQRQRFSIGHELGHWFKDRGKVGNLCSKNDMDAPQGAQRRREVIANEYSAQLLVPSYLLKPALQGSDLSQSLLNEIMASFDISFMAALRRVIESQHHMGFFAIYDSTGVRKVFKANESLPYQFFPPVQAPVGSHIYELIRNKKEASHGLVDGEVWCKTDGADFGVVHENAFHYHNGSYVTLIWWEDEEPIWRFIEEQELGDCSLRE